MCCVRHRRKQRTDRLETIVRIAVVSAAIEPSHIVNGARGFLVDLDALRTDIESVTCYLRTVRRAPPISLGIQDGTVVKFVLYAIRVPAQIVVVNVNVIGKNVRTIGVQADSVRPAGHRVVPNSYTGNVSIRATGCFVFSEPDTVGATFYHVFLDDNVGNALAVENTDALAVICDFILPDSRIREARELDRVAGGTAIDCKDVVQHFSIGHQRTPNATVSPIGSEGIVIDFQSCRPGGAHRNTHRGVAGGVDCIVRYFDVGRTIFQLYFKSSAWAALDLKAL